MSFISYDSAKLTPLKENNPSYQPSQQQILSYAQQILQLTFPTDLDLLYLAQQALKAPLPKDWQACEYFQNNSQQMTQNIIEDESIIVYRNKKTKQVIYDHPLDIVYRQKARQLKLLKNTAKYSQNVTPIKEELMESSVVGLNKNNSKNEENQQNKNSIRIGSSDLNLQGNKYFPSKTSQLVKNITQQSVLYEENSDQFENLSMITDYQELIERQKSENADGKNIQSEQIFHIGKNIVSNNIPSQKLPLKVLKQKPKVIRPIIIPTEKQKQMKMLKQKQTKIQREKQVKAKIQKMILSALMEVNDKEIKRMKQDMKSKISLKNIEQKILIMKEFDNNNNLPPQINRLHQKQAQLKKLQIQNKLMDQKIKQTIKLIQLQKNLSYNPLLFHD